MLEEFYMENNYINDTLLRQIAVQQNVKITQINAVLQLIEGGATVPFIARYRKEVTGNLDEEQIRAIYQEWEYGQKLAERKEDIMRLISEKGKLTDEIFDLLKQKVKDLLCLYQFYELNHLQLLCINFLHLLSVEKFLKHKIKHCQFQLILKEQMEFLLSFLQLKCHHHYIRL